MDYKQPLVYEGLEALIARKFADCIGLAPNYAALYAIPCDSLRSATFTRKYGISASITDEVPYNYFAKAGDAERGVVLMQSEPGVYDKYAVKWLYSVVPGAKTPKEETPTLEKMIRQHAGDPMYFLNSWMRSPT